MIGRRTERLTVPRIEISTEIISAPKQTPTATAMRRYPVRVASCWGDSSGTTPDSSSAVEVAASSAFFFLSRSCGFGGVPTVPVAGSAAAAAAAAAAGSVATVGGAVACGCVCACTAQSLVRVGSRIAASSDARGRLTFSELILREGGEAQT